MKRNNGYDWRVGNDQSDVLIIQAPHAGSLVCLEYITLSYNTAHITS